MNEQSDAFAEAQKSVDKTVNDRVAKLLLNHSHLTRAQLETLLADSISNEKGSKKGQRRLFRPSGRTTSRGSYNRTLIQAQNNVIRSIYTILLMGYVGLFDAPALQPFLELSDNLQSYAEDFKTLQPNEATILQQLEARLWDAISALAQRQSFKDSL
jgi:hypothetical protein